MADDIDIEEHDLLDNPAIKRIFPDLSVLKKEFQSYTEEVQETRSPVVEVNIKSNSLNGSKVENSNIDLISKNSILFNEEESKYMPEPKLNEDIGIKEYQCSSSSMLDNIFLNCNKIILGSKPKKNVSETEYNLKHAKLNRGRVLLQDCGPYLSRSNKYCRDCFILFPELSKFNIHRNKKHSKLKLNMKTVRKIERLNKKRYKCSVCKTTFASLYGLRRHMHNIHGKYATNNNSAINEDPKISQSTELGIQKLTTQLDQKHACFHCDQLFLNKQSLIEHLYQVLQTEKLSCNVCKKQFSNKYSLNVHILTHENTDVNLKKTDSSISDCKKIVANGIPNKKYINLYRCYICSYYMKKKQLCVFHIFMKHNIHFHGNTEKVLFDSNCKHCPSILKNVDSYNVHMYDKHKDILFKKFNERTKTLIQKFNDSVHGSAEDCINSSLSKPVLKSVLFKCTRCDIHFLTSKDTMNHLEHMEMLINWKCATCLKFFKNNDQVFHEKQHQFSEKFTIYDLSEAALAKILYNCPKCGIHFRESQFFNHYPVCGVSISKSFYCNVCDILVDKYVKSMHEEQHICDPLSQNFTIIKTDVILANEKISNDQDHYKRGFEIKPGNCSLQQLATDDGNKHSYSFNFNTVPQINKSKQMLHLNYCSICKCFVTNTTLSREKHRQGRCKNFLQHICKDCGLVLPGKSIVTHRNLHKTNMNLKLKDFVFYDIINKKQICPPVPKYPFCVNCEVHFESKASIITHECNEIEDQYLTCHVCHIKLSETAFKLHMSYHNYTLLGKETESDRILDDNVAIMESDELPDKQQITVPNKQSADVTGKSKYAKGSDSHFIDFIVYNCRNCHITLDDYDKVIEHCQEHYKNVKFLRKTEECDICELKFDITCYKKHEKLHETCSKDSFKVLAFDIFYFTSNNKIWTNHVFGSIPQEHKQKILSKSIYKFERTLMEIIQDGPSNLTVYKCDKCRNFIDSDTLSKHVTNSCFNVRKHPCSYCGLPFISAVSRANHEKIHKQPNISLKSYRIVVFNQIENKKFNSTIFAPRPYVLYQCRTCDGVVDGSQIENYRCSKKIMKKCMICGLLLHDNDYDFHLSKHKDLNTFSSDNMKIILFGDKHKIVSGKTQNKHLNWSFKGLVLDFTYYKCSKCQTCVIGDQNKHLCLLERYQVICPDCEVLFSTIDFRCHRKLHEKHPEFIKECLRVITFDPEILQDIPPPLSEISIARTEENNVQKSDENVTKESNVCEFKNIDIYRCPCGLHFLDELSAESHVNNCCGKIKTSKQNCSKCDLLFTPNVLFNHLLKHHADKNVEYKFDIIKMVKK